MVEGDEKSSVAIQATPQNIVVSYSTIKSGLMTNNTSNQ